MRFNFFRKKEQAPATNEDKALAMIRTLNRESWDDKREIVLTLVRHALPGHHVHGNPIKREVLNG